MVEVPCHASRDGLAAASAWHGDAGYDLGPPLALSVVPRVVPTLLPRATRLVLGAGVGDASTWAVDQGGATGLVAYPLAHCADGQALRWSQCV